MQELWATLRGLWFLVLQVLQHAWTYKPLVQDVLGMSLNRVTLDAEPSTGQQLLQPGAPSKKTYEVGVRSSLSWSANWQPLPCLASHLKEAVREGCSTLCSCC